MCFYSTRTITLAASHCQTGYSGEYSVKTPRSQPSVHQASLLTVAIVVAVEVFTTVEVRLRASLTHTKTTGPGKHIKKVIIHVHRSAELSGHDWIATGLDLWQPISQPRDL